jgi:hypothetical protein
VAFSARLARYSSGMSEPIAPPPDAQTTGCSFYSPSPALTSLDLARQVDVPIADIETQLCDVSPGGSMDRHPEPQPRRFGVERRGHGGVHRRGREDNCLSYRSPLRRRGHPPRLSGAVEVQLAVKKTGDRQMTVTVELAKLLGARAARRGPRPTCRPLRGFPGRLRRYRGSRAPAGTVTRP